MLTNLINEKVALLILDGWGHGDKTISNAIRNARTPFIDSLYKNYPNSELLTDGEHVGLPYGQMGNSEVEHQYWSWKSCMQDLVKINNAIKNDTFKNNKELNIAFSYAKKKSSLYLIGLLSDGGVHSHDSHLVHLCELADKAV